MYPTAALLVVTALIVENWVRLLVVHMRVTARLRAAATPVARLEDAAGVVVVVGDEW